MTQEYIKRRYRRGELYMKQKYFDCHFHIIDKKFPVIPNQGFMPDSFTAENYLERVKAVELCGGAVVSGSAGCALAQSRPAHARRYRCGAGPVAGCPAFLGGR